MMAQKFGEAHGPIALPKRREPVPMLETAMQRIDGTVEVARPKRIGADEQIAPKRRWESIGDEQTIRELRLALQPIKDLGAPNIVEAISNLIWDNKLFGHDYANCVQLWVLIHRSDAPLRELGQAISTALFGDANALIMADCAEDKNDGDYLFGAPPGYEGYLQGGVISNHLKTRPESVVMLQNFEFADGSTLGMMDRIARNAQGQVWGTRGGERSELPLTDALFVLATTRTFSDKGNDPEATLVTWLKNARPDYNDWNRQVFTIGAKGWCEMSVPSVRRRH